MTNLSCSSCSGKFRVLDIKLKKYETSSEHHKTAKFYVNLWIHPDTKLQTRFIAAGGSDPVERKQRFVFWVPENFIRGKNSTVQFEVFRARKHLPDMLVGTAQCNLNTLFKDIEESKLKRRETDEKEVVYDTEEEYESYEDPGYHSMFHESNKDDESDDHKEEYKEPEPDGLKATTSIQVCRGSKSKGTLSLDVALWKGYVKSIGGANGKNVAMGYAEFMGFQPSTVQEERKKNYRSWFCFAPAGKKASNSSYH